MTWKLAALLAAALELSGQPLRVATVGDSFADSLYNSMRARPDLIREHGVVMLRWSRPIVGLTRTDYFDYVSWLRDAAELGAADLCFVEIGANDMQSIPVEKRWTPYGTDAWKAAYAGRTAAMARILAGRRCGQVIWVRQPDFEKRNLMACHGALINEVQSNALHLDRTRVLEMTTNSADYGRDNTHFNRKYLLEIGPAMFQLVDAARQIVHGQCLTCHRNVEAPVLDAGLPLRWWKGDPVAPTRCAASLKTGTASRTASRGRARRRSRRK